MKKESGRRNDRMIQVVTFNIRCDYGQDEANNFCFRQDKIREKLEREKPDIVCFQEVLPHVAKWLKRTLPEYDILGCGRSGEFADEYAAVAYRRERFDLVSFDTFWLSETPDVPGSRYPEQSICPRTASEAVLYDREEEALCRVVNTHLDHESEAARELGLRQILNRLEKPGKFADAAVVLAGDFNALPGFPELEALKECPFLKEVSAETGGTFHGYGRLPQAMKIDYIYASDSFEAAQVELWEDQEEGVYLSDHYPISARLVRTSLIR